MTLRKTKLQQLIFSTFFQAHSRCVAHLHHFVFEIEVNYPHHKVLKFFQQELLKLPLVKRPTLEGFSNPGFAKKRTKLAKDNIGLCLGLECFDKILVLVSIF